jgi:hypothetical protein
VLQPEAALNIRPPDPMPMRQQDVDNREFVHRIDAEDRLSFVNDAWLEFAAENAGPDDAEAVLGSPLMAHISDAETRHIYRLLIDRIRETGRPIHFRYRCDSPNVRRFMEMRMDARPEGQIEFRSRVLRSEGREWMPVLDPTLPHRSDHPLQICSWCKAVYTRSAWLKLEEAVQTLDMLAEAVLPQLSHGICPACSDRMTSVGGAP